MDDRPKKTGCQAGKETRCLLSQARQHSFCQTQRLGQLVLIGQGGLDDPQWLDQACVLQAVTLSLQDVLRLWWQGRAVSRVDAKAHWRRQTCGQAPRSQ